MRRLHALNVSDSDTTRGVGQAESPGPTSMPPRADMAPRRGLLRVEEAALAGVDLHAICRAVEAEKLHLIELADGLSFLCLNSLLNQF